MRVTRIRQMTTCPRCQRPEIDASLECRSASDGSGRDAYVCPCGCVYDEHGRAMRESDPPLTAAEQAIEDAYQADPMEWGSEAACAAADARAAADDGETEPV